MTPADFNWTWKNILSASPEDTALPEEETAAVLVSAPKDGQRVVIYNEAEQRAVTGQLISGFLEAEPWEAQGPALKAPQPDAALVFTAQTAENGTVRFRDPEGRWLVPADNGLTLSAEPESEELTWWTTEPAYGGWYIVNAEMKDRALAAGNGLTAVVQGGERDDAFVFNFYEPVGEKP